MRLNKLHYMFTYENKLQNIFTFGSKRSSYPEIPAGCICRLGA